MKIAYPRKSPGSPAGDLVKTQNVVIVDSEDETVNQFGSWSSVAAEDAAGLTYLQSDSVNAYVEYKFVGTAVWLRYFAGTNKGRANVYIDGGTAKTLEMFSATARPRMSWLATNLSAGVVHTVKVEVARTKHTSSSGYNVTVDTFVVELSAGALQTWVMIEEGIPVSLSLPFEDAGGFFRQVSHAFPLPVVDLGRPITSLIPTGRVVMTDDFEGTPVNWETSGTVTLASDNGTVLRGSKAAKLVTGAVAGNSASIAKRFAPLRNMQVGMELWFLMDWTNCRDIRFEIGEGYTGTQTFKSEVKYVFADSKLQYYNENSVYTDVPNGSVTKWRANPESYVHCKIAVDWTNQRYMWISLADQLIDMSSLIPPIITSTTRPQWWMQVAITTDAAAAVTCYIDDIILTNHEVQII